MFSGVNKTPQSHGLDQVRNVTGVLEQEHALTTHAGKKAYALHRQTVEPVFGIIKSVTKLRQFMRCGLANVRNQWTLVCLAWNPKRPAALRPESALGS